MRLSIFRTNKASIPLLPLILLIAAMSLSVGSVVTAKPSDMVKPRVTLTVSKTLITTAQTLRLTAQASDNVEVKQVVFFDGTSKLSVDSNAPYQFDLKLSTAQNGIHRFSAQAFDAAKNQGISPVLTVQVKIPDDLKPKVDLMVSKTRVATNEKFTLTANATDNVTVSKVQFFDGSTPVFEDLTAPYRLETSLSAGASKIFSARAFDLAGNVGVSKSVKVLVDDTQVKQFGTNDDDLGSGVVVDATGNVYITGVTSGSFPGNSNAGKEDVFLIKFDVNGAQQWVKQLGTDGNDSASGVVVDVTGNVYITGEAGGSFPGTSNAGKRDIFLMKFDANGTQQWVKQFGTNDDDLASGVALDATGNVYVVGTTDGSFPGNGNVGESGCFLLKFNANGTQRWVKQFGTESFDNASGVAVDVTGNVYITGQTGGSFPGNINVGGWDVFLMKFDVNGTQQWLKQLGTTESEFASGVAVDASNNVYITGQTGGSFPGNSNVGYFDGLLMKFDANGSQRWVKQFGSDNDDYVHGVAVDVTGNAYITGETRGSFRGNSSAGASDVFLLKFDVNGTQQWLKQLGTDNEEAATGIAIDATGDVHITGIAFGSFPGNSSAGKADVFLMKFDANGTSR
jgi:Bacterial Ig domain/Beta-propeller repeat